MPVIYEKSLKIGRLTARLKIQSVPISANRPDGHKVNFVLLDEASDKVLLLVDNHAPYGYHMHSDPADHNQRQELLVHTSYEALDLFIKKAGEIANGE